MSVRPLIHVGYHKTATTWMQQLLFTPDHGFRQIAGHREVFDHIVGPHGLEFDADSIQPVTQYVSAAFRGRYAASNARLAAMLGPETDLSDYT